MRRILISVILLAGTAVLSFCSVREVNGSADRFTDEVSAVARAFSEGESEMCAEAAEKLRDDWQIFLDRTVLHNDPDLVKSITETIAELAVCAKQGSGELAALCSRAAAQFGLLKRAQEPTLRKVL